MGGESAEISLDGNPNIILLSGLQGSGKTTFTGKLGRYLTKKGKKTLLVAVMFTDQLLLNNFML